VIQFRLSTLFGLTGAAALLTWAVIALPGLFLFLIMVLIVPLLAVSCGVLFERSPLCFAVFLLLALLGLAAVATIGAGP
jgi:hypothetical protein